VITAAGRNRVDQETSAHRPGAVVDGFPVGLSIVVGVESEANTRPGRPLSRPCDNRR